MSGNSPNLRDPDGTGMKRCNGCEEYLPVDSYGVKTHRKDGSPVWQTRCRPCRHSQQWAATQARREQRANATCPVDRELPIRLPIGPWRDWLSARLAMPDVDQQTLSDRMGVDQRQLSRWLGLHGEGIFVNLDTVDAALCKLGDPGLLRDLYPALYAFDDEELAA